MYTKIGTIETERLVLKVANELFASIILNYFLRNKEFLNKWEPNKKEDFYTLDHCKKALNRDLHAMNQGDIFKVWIFKKTDRTLEKTIGSIILDNIIWGDIKSCHLGYRLDKDEINNGYITEGLKAIIDFAFNELKLHRIEAYIMPRNIRSLKVARKLNFYEEGIAREYIRINRKWEDHKRMVLLNNKK
ncbi:MAG: GNAT family N-acetyltransferase [Firmicutes bacterium]|nr:GNAT family N-acetyltransferase [Bacillota bacterium]